jgi:hypothetical protein
MTDPAAPIARTNNTINHFGIGFLLGPGVSRGQENANSLRDYTVIRSTAALLNPVCFRIPVHILLFQALVAMKRFASLGACGQSAQSGVTWRKLR